MPGSVGPSPPRPLSRAASPRRGTPRTVNEAPSRETHKVRCQRRHPGPRGEPHRHLLIGLRWARGDATTSVPIEASAGSIRQSRSLANVRWLGCSRRGTDQLLSLAPTTLSRFAFIGRLPYRTLVSPSVFVVQHTWSTSCGAMALFIAARKWVNARRSDWERERWDQSPHIRRTLASA